MQSEKEALIAIDVLLDPDATMLSRAEAANARLRENFPKGYALDALHAPHISVLQRHVRTRDLDSIYVAVQRVFETESLAELQLKATGYYYIPFSEKGMPMGLAGIVIEPTPGSCACSRSSSMRWLRFPRAAERQRPISLHRRTHMY